MSRFFHIVTEGGAVPFGYGFVRYRFDYMGKQLAIMPFNWIIRAVDWLQRKSYAPPTERELKAIRLVRELQVEANRKGYERGYDDGKEAGEAHMVALFGEVLRTGVDAPANENRNK